MGNKWKIGEHKFKSFVYELCIDAITKRSYDEIYDLAALRYPSISKVIPKASIVSSMHRWKKCNSTIPSTIAELEEQMLDPDFYHKYGRNTFGLFEATEDGYRMYDGVREAQFCDIDNKMVVSKVVAFKCHAAIEHVRGTAVDLAGDGTGTICPTDTFKVNVKFDDTQQLFVVHMIQHKRFTPIGFFLLQHFKEEVYETVFSIVKEWLQAETTVKTIMLDFESASRNAAKTVWPNIRVLPCAFHYQKAIGYFAIEHGIFYEELQSTNHALLDKALGLCFLPPDDIARAVDLMSINLPASSKRFADALIPHLKRTWVPKEISVANLEVRVNNGSEIYFSACKRHQRSQKNNILDFCIFLQTLNRKLSIELTQWNYFKQSEKQKQLERSIAENLQTYRRDKEHLSFEIAVNNFLFNTKYITHFVHKFHNKLQVNLDNQPLPHINAIDYSDVAVIAEQSESKTRNKCKDKIVPRYVRLIPINNESFTMKQIVVNNISATPVGIASKCKQERPNNAIFNNSSISEHHAEFKLNDNKLFVRDVGSVNGTFINGIRTGRSGVPWTPQLVNCGSRLKFGAVEMTVQIVQNMDKNENELESDISGANDNASNCTTVKIILHQEDKYPIRTISLKQTCKDVIGRATYNNGCAPNNALIQTSGISKRQIEIWTNKEETLFGKRLSSSFGVKLNDKKMNGLQTIVSGSTISMGNNDHVRATILIVQQPQQTFDTMTINLYPISIGATFYARTLSITHEMKIGRQNRHQSESAENAIFTAKNMSKCHAKFSIKDKKLMLSDYNSLSGTFVTKKDEGPVRVVPDTFVEIETGDVLQFGHGIADGADFIKTVVNITTKSTLTRPSLNDAITSVERTDQQIRLDDDDDDEHALKTVAECHTNGNSSYEKDMCDGKSSDAAGKDEMQYRNYSNTCHSLLSSLKDKNNDRCDYIYCENQFPVNNHNNDNVMTSHQKVQKKGTCDGHSSSSDSDDSSDHAMENRMCHDYSSDSSDANDSMDDELE